MRLITSLTHPQIKYIVQLHQPKARKHHNQTFAEGYRTLITLNKAGIIFNQLYSTPDQQHLLPAFQAHEVILVTPAVMAKISAAVTPSGLLAVFTRPTSLSAQEAQKVTVGLVLAQIQDPGNMGTLLRTAAACAVKTVVIIEGADPWSPKVIQASAGTVALLTLLQWDWHKVITYKYTTPNILLCALVVSDGIPPHELTAEFYQKKRALVVGNEAQGIPQAWQDQCDMRLSLPMPGAIESLNAAVAGSIALYITHVLPYTCI